MARETSAVLWAYYSILGGFPATEAEFNNLANTDESIDLLTNHLRVTRPPVTPGGLPAWAQAKLREEMGADAYYVTIPELTPIILQATAENWAADKTRAKVEATAWWQKTTSTQRQWGVASPAERAQSVSTSAIWVVETLRGLYGPNMVESKGWNLSNPEVLGWANDIASGASTSESFTFAHRGAAEGMEGTTAYTTRAELQRQAGKEKSAVADIGGKLRQTWQEWMGTNIGTPDLKGWAESISQNTSSQEDFLKYVRETAKSAYPNKPEWLSFNQWVEPAKAMLSRRLDLGAVDDNDPLIASYTRGEIPSLADLDARARQDRRYERTSGAVKDARSTATDLMNIWGF